MQLLVLLIVIWFIAQSASKKKAKKATTQQTSQSSGAAPKAAPAPRQLHRDDFKGAQAAFNFEESESAVDIEGCVGGSIIHDHHEGVALPGSLDYEPAAAAAEGSVRDWREASIPEKAYAAPSVRPTPRQMRQAVVWAEVLDRPVSMRKTRTGGR